MWPPGYYSGSPFSASPLSDYGPMQQYQQQQAMQGMSRHQQVRQLPLLPAASMLREMSKSQTDSQVFSTHSCIR